MYLRLEHIYRDQVKLSLNGLILIKKLIGIAGQVALFAQGRFKKDKKGLV